MSTRLEAWLNSRQTRPEVGMELLSSLKPEFRSGVKAIHPRHLPAVQKSGPRHLLTSVADLLTWTGPHGPEYRPAQEARDVQGPADTTGRQA